MQYVARVAPIVGGLLALLLLGLADMIAQLRGLAARRDFSVEFQNHWAAYFRALVQGQPAAADYAWLTGHQARMTAELGSADRIDYRAPFSQYVIQNYPALTNTLAAARTGRGAHPDMVAFVDHLLISQAGVLRDGHQSLLPKLKNPVYLIGRGLRFVLSLPLFLLSWSGLLPAARLEGARNSWLFRFVQFIVAAVVAVAAVITVVLGWSAFVVQLKAWFQWVP
jgi:hypothetical protein